ncbi:MAG: hypothetical protein A2W90_10650 [Bacteroidetes bacterium GWF2_42_66]|nr:MAG: hypothetical protein A2W89_23920 [Bacteroidetes bacterium GWE2_42_39]OFY44743.1 MAG: hypothetical protein A2W90_10650 [Bacteroidetes bacterium GWF2_42_66]
MAQSFSDPVMKPCIECEELLNLQLPDVSVSEVTKMEEEKPYCKVLGIIGKEIKFELLLPMKWNGRFVMGGGGGFVGTIQNGARSKVNEGFATVGTNTGHEESGYKAEWALNNMERQVNFGFMAVHRTAVTAKRIINHFYSFWPEYSYFIGCSRGGGQALIEAQRYPGDFDGIVAGAPIIDWPASGAEFVQNSQAVYPNPSQLNEPVLTKKHLEMLQSAVLEQCDEMDGLKDSILNRPDLCPFDFSTLPRCPGDSVGADCFTAAQIKAIKTIYEGVSNPDGSIYPGFPPGGENEKGGWLEWIVGINKNSAKLGFPSYQFAFGTEIYKYLIFNNPTWDYSTYDFSNYTNDTRYASAYLNATASDYSGFKKRNGKMIIYHGWNDPALSVYTAIQHYTEAQKSDNNIQEYIRLFLLPGVLHCGGGTGPGKADWIHLIRDWVENNHAPEWVVVTKQKNGETIMARPVFPYPGTAEYDGSGNPNKESSFFRKN